MQTLTEANILQYDVEFADFFQTSSEHFVFFHYSDVHGKWKTICLNSCTHFLNFALWLFSHLDQQYVLLLHSPQAIVSFFYLLLASLPLLPLRLLLYLILQLLNPLPQHGVLSLSIPQPLLDVLIGCDQGEVGSNGFIAGTHRYRTLARCGVGSLMFKDANVIIHCQGLHACTGLLCSRWKT